MSENAITVKKLDKYFKLPHEKHNTLKGLFINVFNRKRSFERQHVLENINFTVKKGEFFGIVGRNGSGKSTLLKLLAGIYSPNKGEIQVNGQLTPFIELGVGFNPELTGRENVFLNGALLGFNRKEMSDMYEDIVDFAELRKFMDQKLKNYSSGMQVRLAFSIAIRAKSDILLIDEVLAVGDAAFQRKCFDYFMDIKKEKHTLILVTHDMAAVRRYCDRAIMIDKGHLVERGSPEQVAQAYQRLFSNESGLQKTKPNSGQRWGSGKVTATKTSVQLSRDEIHITVKYLANEYIAPPVVGFSISSPTGQNLIEGNTLREKFKTREINKGESMEVLWTMPNILATGLYKVNVAICDQSTTDFYDWYNEAATIDINRENETSGIIDPQLTVKYVGESNK